MSNEILYNHTVLTFIQAGASAVGGGADQSNVAQLQRELEAVRHEAESVRVERDELKEQNDEVRLVPLSYNLVHVTSQHSTWTTLHFYKTG